MYTNYKTPKERQCSIYSSNFLVIISKDVNNNLALNTLNTWEQYSFDTHF